MQNYTVSSEFKTRVTDLLNTKKYTQVFPFMNLINRQGDIYNETELNSLVQLLGEYPYSEVAEFFSILHTLVKAVDQPNVNQPAKTADAEPIIAE